ncbi:MAG: hypothetical protein ACFBSE_19915 [Prochloraceae cyanobacterium]
MKHYCDEWIEQWCLENGWSDLYIEQNQYWAFRPGAVMPEPIPPNILHKIKQEKGLSPKERYWSIAAIAIAIIGIIVSICFRCPLFLVFAFTVDSFTVANLDLENI